MANSANPEINKKIATSALGTLVIATVFFYLGDRYAETLVTYPGQIFDHLSDAFLSMWQTIKDAPFALDMTSNSLPFKISRSVSRNRRRNSPNSKRRKRNLKRRFASGTESGALWSPIPLVKVCSPPSVALGRNSTSTHSTASLRATQTRCAPCSLSMEAPRRMPRRVSMHARRKR